MPTATGSFSGKVKVQTAMTVSDKPNHQIMTGEVTGEQHCSDNLWNNTTVNYWATSDITDGRGTQHGYFVNDHGENGRDWGTFKGTVSPSGAELAVEGEYEFTGGTGRFAGISGKGTFRSRMTSPTDVACTWQGAYEIPAVRSQAG
jgi:hypothetical protein